MKSYKLKFKESRRKKEFFLKTDVNLQTPFEIFYTPQFLGCANLGIGFRDKDRTVRNGLVETQFFYQNTLKYPKQSTYLLTLLTTFLTLNKSKFSGGVSKAKIGSMDSLTRWYKKQNKKTKNKIKNW